MKLKNILIVSLLFLTGCAATQPVARAPLNLPNPPPVKMQPIAWQVLPLQSPKGADPDVVKHTVIFGLSEMGFKSLAENLQNVINFMTLQGKVLSSYRKYYEQNAPLPHK